MTCRTEKKEKRQEVSQAREALVDIAWVIAETMDSLQNKLWCIFHKEFTERHNNAYNADLPF
jgi:hypothetical protein